MLKTINLIAGFDPENPLNDDLERAACDVGWSLNRITHIASEKIMAGELEDVFPGNGNVLWRRELDGNTSRENDLVWQWLDEHHKVTMNTHVLGGRTQAIDKYWQQLRYYEVPELKKFTVPSFVAADIAKLRELLDKKLPALPGLPIVLKPRYGSLGKGIKLIHNLSELTDWAKEMPNLEGYVVEPYIDLECDYRVFVIGGKALAAMGKVGYEERPDDFEAKSAGVRKWHEQGPTLKSELYRIAENAARRLQLEYAGVDIGLERKTGKLYLLETNLSGGWNNGFSQITGVDVSAKIVEWFVAQNK